MKDTTQEFARYILKLNSTFGCWGRFEFIMKNFCSGSIYISLDNVEDYSDASKAISDLQQLRLPSLDSISSSEQYTLFEAFLSALEPLDYLSIKAIQTSDSPINRSGYVEISRKNAYVFVMTAALNAEHDSKQSSIPYLNTVFENFASDANFFVPTPHRVLTDLAFDAGVIVLEQSLKQLSVLCYVNNQ